jgi:hypothetical protein
VALRGAEAPLFHGGAGGGVARRLGSKSKSRARSEATSSAKSEATSRAKSEATSRAKSEATSKATDRSVRPTRATPTPTAAGFACMDSRGRLSPHESKADLGRGYGTRLLHLPAYPTVNWWVFLCGPYGTFGSSASGRAASGYASLRQSSSG